MPRGAEYDDGVPHSDNAINPGPNKVHGTNPAHDHIGRVDHTAPLPDVPAGHEMSIGAAPGHSSGKGGHEPHTLGDKRVHGE